MHKWQVGTAAVACALLIASGARAQNKVVLPKEVNVLIDAYVDCVGSRAWDEKGSSAPSEVLIDRAMESCTQWRDRVRDEVMRPPLNASPLEAESAIRQMLGKLRPEMVDKFKEMRGI